MLGQTATWAERLTARMRAVSSAVVNVLREVWASVLEMRLPNAGAAVAIRIASTARAIIVSISVIPRARRIVFCMAILP